MRKIVNDSFNFGFLFQGQSYLKRASTDKLKEIFNKYATTDLRGEKVMSSSDFVRGFLGLFPGEDFNEVSFGVFHVTSMW